MKKDKLFQYYDGYKTVEDTDLITESEANELWDKYFEEAKNNLKEGRRVQMCIWSDCESDTSYHKEEKSIDHYDCIVERNSVFRIKKEEVSS